MTSEHHQILDRHQYFELLEKGVLTIRPNPELDLQVGDRFEWSCERDQGIVEVVSVGIIDWQPKAEIRKVR